MWNHVDMGRMYEKTLIVYCGKILLSASSNKALNPSLACAYTDLGQKQ